MSQGNGIDLSVAFGGPQDTRAQQISANWMQWSSARHSAATLWDEVYRYVFATSTRDTTNETVTNWSNTTHRPKMGNLYDTLTINYDRRLFPNADWLKFKGGDQEAVTNEKRRIVESYMKTKHSLRASGFRDTMRVLEADWVLFGNAFASVDYVNELVLDPRVGQSTTAYVGPKVNRLDPRRIAFLPMGTTFKKTPKIVRSLFSIAELHRIAEENPDQGHFKEILEIAIQNRSAIRQFDQGDLLIDNELAFDGFGTPMEYLNSGLVEVLDFYGDMYIAETGEFFKNHVLTTVDRWQTVRDEPIDTWDGTAPIYHVGWRSRPGNLWAQGPLDNLVGLQYRMDHLENARADAFDQMLDPDILFAGDVEDIMQVGGAKHYYMPEQGNVVHLRPDTTVLNADLQINELQSTMELFALAPREALGVRSPGEKTKFEVQELATAASKAFDHKVLIFQEFVEEIVNGELEAAVRNLNSKDIIEITDDDLGAVEFLTITKSDLTANGRLIPVGARHFAREAQLAQELAQLQQGPLQDPEVAQHFSSRKLAEIWGELLELSGVSLGVVQPYVRISERLEAQRRTQVAEDQALEESQTQPLLGGEDIGQQIPADAGGTGIG